eukprot:3838908-Rhodomonas_salina.3
MTRQGSVLEQLEAQYGKVACPYKLSAMLLLVRICCHTGVSGTNSYKLQPTYTMAGTDRGYAATRPQIPLRCTCSVISGTGVHPEIKRKKPHPGANCTENTGLDGAQATAPQVTPSQKMA